MMLHQKLLHFLSCMYTAACLEVRYRSVALSQAQWIRLCGGGARGYQTRIDVLLMMMIHLDQTLAVHIK